LSEFNNLVLYIERIVLLMIIILDFFALFQTTLNRDGMIFVLYNNSYIK